MIEDMPYMVKLKFIAESIPPVEWVSHQCIPIYSEL